MLLASELSYFEMIVQILNEKYGVDTEIGKNATKIFLNKFCDDPPFNEELEVYGRQEPIDLEKWRIRIWQDALGDYRNIAEEIYRTWLRIRYECVALKEEVKSMLIELRKKFPIIIITNGRSEPQWEKINILNIKDLVDVIIVSGDFPWDKPDPQIFLEACDKCGVHPENCLMIGDRLETDIEGAIRAKFGAAILINIGRYTEEDLQQSKYTPDIIIYNIMELKELLSAL